MPAERRLTSAEIRRKTNKPIMEKKRRERINNCLEELKNIVLIALNEESRPNKLEKADILEMTVRYLRTMRQQERPKDTDNNISTSQDISKPSIKCEYNGYPMMREHGVTRFTPYPRHQFARNQMGQFQNHCQDRIPVPVIPGKYSPIPVSPISSISSKSPGRDSFEDSELGYRPMEQLINPYTCQVVPNHTLISQTMAFNSASVSPTSSNDSIANQTNDIWENSQNSSIEFPTERYNNLCAKSDGYIWRPWGVAS